jgi:hypothetical protein
MLEGKLPNLQLLSFETLGNVPGAEAIRDRVLRLTPSLIHLQLCFSTATSNLSAFFKLSFSTIRHLTLSNNRTAYAILKNCCRLESLTLINVFATARGPVELPKLTKLDILDLSEGAMNQLSNMVAHSLEDISINSSMCASSLSQLGVLLFAWRSDLKHISLHNVGGHTLSQKQMVAI